MHAAPVGQTCPHAPQFRSSVPTKTHDVPHRVDPVQHPAPHPGGPPQLPQTGLVALHVFPHAPQFVADVRLVSQPFAAMRSQSSQPAMQLKPHVPPAHDAVACGGAEQADPHTPQWFASVARFTHAPPQFVRPTGHTQSQLPPAQTHPGGQTSPHAPQWFMSVRRSTHVGQVEPATLQAVSPAGHASTHAPFEHT